MKKIKLFFKSLDFWVSLAIFSGAILISLLFPKGCHSGRGVSKWIEATVVERVEIRSSDEKAELKGIRLILSNQLSVNVPDFNKRPDLLFLKDKQVG